MILFIFRVDNELSESSYEREILNESSQDLDSLDLLEIFDDESSHERIKPSLDSLVARS